VGASCTLIEIEGRRVLVDAGIRMGAPAGSHLPNFSILDDVGPPEEVLLTHAHTDHTGALPVLAGSLPANVTIRCTDPTRSITQVLLNDALKIMELRGERDGDLPLYPPEAVQACLARIRPVPPLVTTPICGGALRATWIPSGHILGASQIYIEGRSESLLMTGDVSVAHQKSIPGMVVPQCRPDVMVMESTYGNRQHADRDQQEASLARRVADVVESGGKVLVPAFAVGRAQEVVLILAEAMRKGDIPRFPVYVDGMVRSVNAVYAAHMDYLSPRLRRQVEKDDPLFYSEMISAVSVRDDRDRILDGPPCCVVASSGMLLGGASSYYAERLVEDEANLIAITGYQDEESPGRALLDVASAPAGTRRELTLNGERRRVVCRVETYSLSAHADAGELLGLAQRLQPDQVFLVHGDDDARAALSQRLDVHLAGGVRLPQNGETVETSSGKQRRKSYGRSVPANGISRGRALDEAALDEVRRYLEETGAKGAYRAQELAEVWYGTGAQPHSAEEVRDLLQAGGGMAFQPDRQRPYLYRPAEEVRREASGRADMNAARERLRAAFPEEAGLYRCSAYAEEGVFELAFHFPDTIPGRFSELLETLEAETGWALRLRATPHQEMLFRAAEDHLPEGALVLKTPGLRLEDRVVVVQIGGKRGDVDVEGFRERTGYLLEVLVAGEELQKPSNAEAPEDAWEVNAAYGAIRRAFEKLPHAPYRVGKKQDADGSYIEAAFISPDVGARYSGELEKLSEEIGWSVRVRSTANQEMISREAQRLTPKACTLRGSPKLYGNEKRVVVPVLTAPGENELADLRRAFQEATGYVVEWEPRRQ